MARTLFYQMLILLAAMRLAFGLLSNGTCPLISFVPFTYADKRGTDTTNEQGNSIHNNLGFSHMAAAVLAMKQFNARDPSIVPELGEAIFEDCNVKFDTNRSRFFDTGVVTHTSTRLLQGEMRQNGIPCAIAGPYNDLPAELLSTLAASVEIPLVAHRAFNLRITERYFSPFTSQVYPDQITLGQALFSFLKYKGRNNYIALLYSVIDSATQQQEIIKIILQGHGIKYNLYPYEFDTSFPLTEQNIDPTSRLSNVLRKLKEEGFRTIVTMTEFPELEMRFIARAAKAAGLSGDDYFWIFLGVDLTVFALPPVDLSEEGVIELLAGSAMISPLEGFQINPNDRFLLSWHSQNASFVDQVNAFHSIAPGSQGFYKAEAEYFKSRPETGAGFMFDAVMSIGLGACLAETVADNLTGDIHLRGIRSVNFTGATGHVVLGSELSAGKRNASFVKFGVVNLFHEFALKNDSEWKAMLERKDGPALFQISDILESNGAPIHDAEWRELNPFVFRSGSFYPPKLLRTTPEQNYLSPAVRAVGLFLMSIALASCVAAAIWVFCKRDHRIICAAQPYALYLICLGSFVTSWAIFPLSWDESYGWTNSQLDAACNAVPWLASIGHIITYGALFGKLWRLNKVLQFRRTTVKIAHVAWPATLLCFLAVALLSIMTVVSPLMWVRVEIDPFTGESIARCDSIHDAAFLVTLALIMLIPTILTGWMASKTLDVDTTYSDAFWVGALILVQVEVILLGIPVMVILRQVSTDGRYFGVVVMLWTFPASTLCLIILPKVVAYRRAVRGNGNRTPRGSGGAGMINVTGLQMTNVHETTVEPTTTSQSETVHSKSLGTSMSLPVCTSRDG